MPPLPSPFASGLQAELPRTGIDALDALLRSELRLMRMIDLTATAARQMLEEKARLAVERGESPDMRSAAPPPPPPPPPWRVGRAGRTGARKTWRGSGGRARRPRSIPTRAVRRGLLVTPTSFT